MEQEPKIVRPRAPGEWESAVLEEGELYLVGGVVRDMLLGCPDSSADQDYVVTGLAYERLGTILERYGTANRVGKSFGVVKFTTADRETVDISLPRSEVSTGHGHREFDVSCDPDLPIEADLARRDFTLNSMAVDLRTMRLVDPLGGRTDLADRILRMNRDTSFKEDPLRILRGVQFMARFDLSVDQRTRRLMERDAALLGTVSMERIRDELNKLIELAARPSKGFAFMHETGILGRILPELEETWGIEQNEYHPDDVFTHSVLSCDMARGDLAVRWAALLHDLGKKAVKQERDGRVVFYRHEEESARSARALLRRLVFPAAFIERVERLVYHHMFLITDEWSDGAVRRFIARVGQDNLEDLFALRRADGASRDDEAVEEEIARAIRRTSAVIAQDAVFKREDLAIGGREVMEATGLGPGPEIGSILDALLEAVLDDPSLNTKEDLVDMVRRMRGGDA